MRSGVRFRRFGALVGAGAISVLLLPSSGRAVAAQSATPHAGTRLSGLPPCTCDYFGGSVAVSGTTAVVGTPGTNDGAGRVEVYTETSGTWTHTAELQASDAGSGASFGASVAISGTTLVVGSPRHSNQGRAYVFTLTSGSWLQSAELQGADTGTNDWFGGSVALSASTVVVGAPLHAASAGSAYVFTDVSGAWTQAAEMSGIGTKGENFGYAVAVSDTTAIVGAPGQSKDGRAYVYAQAGGMWTKSAVLKGPSPAASTDFGNAVALSGTTAVVGAWSTDKGAAYVFSDVRGSWAQTAKLQTTDVQGGDDLGASVAISGSTIVVGGVIAYGNIGAAYVFTKAGGTWTQTAALAPPGNDGGAFFSSRSLSLSGSTVFVGAPGHGGGPTGGTSGAAFAFSDAGGSWVQVADIGDTYNYAGNNFGAAVATSGTTAVAGAPGFQGGRGRAYLITPDTANFYTPALALNSFDTSVGDAFGTSVSLTGITALVGAPGHGGGRAYVFTETTHVPYSGGTVRCLAGGLPGGHFFGGECRSWVQTAELKGSDTTNGDAVGTSVAVSGATAVLGAPGHGGGRAYVFTENADGTWTQTAELKGANEQAGDAFGTSVAISGTHVVVGAPTRNGGRVYLFTKAHGTWTQTAELLGSDTASGDALGTSVGVSDDAVVAGAPAHGGGRAYIFMNGGTGWAETAEVVGADIVAGDGFGRSVGVANGSAVVGAPAHAGGGMAYLFKDSGGAWAQRSEMSGSSAVAGTGFGSAVAISSTWAIVGAPFFSSGVSKATGNGFVFKA